MNPDDEIRNLVNQLHEVSTKIAVHSERIAAAGEAMAKLPCAIHAAQFAQMADSINKLSVSHNVLAESHGVVKALTFGITGLILTAVVTAGVTYIIK